VIALSRGTVERIDALFPPPEREAVSRALLERCGDNLPLVHTSFVALTERIRFAVLKLSCGSLEGLERHLDIAALDWRDVLLAAGFGSDLAAHLDWHPQPAPFHASRHAPLAPPGVAPSKGRKA
jgi:hypothetical protein